MPSIMGRSSSWFNQQVRRVSRGRNRSQLVAVAVPYRVVSVIVAVCGFGQVVGSARANSPPCLGGRPLMPGPAFGCGQP